MDGFPNSGVLVQHLHYHVEAYFEDVSNNLTPKPGFYHAPKPTLRFTEQHGVHQVHQVCADFWCAAIWTLIFKQMLQMQNPPSLVVDSGVGGRGGSPIYVYIYTGVWLSSWIIHIINTILDHLRRLQCWTIPNNEKFCQCRCQRN